MGNPPGKAENRRPLAASGAERSERLERFRALLDHTSEIIFLVHLSSRRIVDANAAASRLLGYACAELCTMSLAEVVQLDALDWLEGDDPSSEEGRVTTRLRCKDASEIPVEVSFSVDRFGDAAYAVAVARDITERLRADQILQRHQVLLDSVLNHTDNAIVALDEERRVIYYNEQFLELYHLERQLLDTAPTIDDLIRRTCAAGLYPADQAEQLIARRLAHLASDAPDNLIETPRLDGTLVEGYATPLPGGGHLLAFRDITARKRAEEALRESEERFRSLFEAAAAGMVILSPEGRILRANPTFCRTSGYAEEELLGMHVLDGTHPDDREETGHLYGELRSGRRSTLEYEKRYLRKDGSVVWGHVTVAGVYDPGGDLAFSVALIQDVTARRVAEEALRESEARFRSIFSMAAAGLTTFTLDGRFLQANPALCRFLGYDEAELLTLHVEDITHPEDLERTRLGYGELVQGERPVLEYEKRYVRKDGAVVWGHATVACVRTPSRPGYCVGLVQDITERRRAEEVLRASDRMKTEFISTAAHELRTPLASILGFSQVLLEQNSISTAERREFLSYIHEKAGALSAIIADLLDIARIESGQSLSLNREPCTARELLRLVAPLLQSRDALHRFDLDLDEADTLLNVDKGKMGQVLENLISNAVNYSPDGGSIRVTGMVAGGEYRLAVIDHGIGMTPGQVERVFDKFYRADASDTALEGLGLGMSIVRNIVEAHGGTIGVESVLAVGTTVHFTVPLLQEA